jgi:hypothetical protein
MRTPNLLIIPSTIDPPVREAGQAARVQMEPPLDERSGPGRPGLLGLPGLMAGGMISPPNPGARAPRQRQLARTTPGPP